MVERERNVASRHRQALHRIEAGGILGARTAQELAAGRYPIEGPLDRDPRSRRKCSRPLPRQFAVIDFDPPAIRSPHAAFDLEPRDAGYRRERFAAETEARHLVD